MLIWYTQVEMRSTKILKYLELPNSWTKQLLGIQNEFSDIFIFIG